MGSKLDIARYVDLTIKDSSRIAKCIQEIYFLGSDQDKRIYHDTRKIFDPLEIELPASLMDNSDLLNDLTNSPFLRKNVHMAHLSDFEWSWKVKGGLAYCHRMKIDPVHSGQYYDYLIRQNPTWFKAEKDLYIV